MTTLRPRPASHAGPAHPVPLPGSSQDPHLSLNPNPDLQPSSRDTTDVIPHLTPPAVPTSTCDTCPSALSLPDLV